MAEKRGTRSTDENGERGDKKEPLVTVVLPDNDTLEAMFQVGTNVAVYRVGQ